MALQHDPLPLETFGTRLAIVRQYLGGWNVKRTASACGIDDQTWRNWEAGRNLPHDLEGVCRRISEALGIDYVWLMVGGPLRTRPTKHAGRGPITDNKSFGDNLPDNRSYPEKPRAVSLLPLTTARSITPRRSDKEAA